MAQPSSQETPSLRLERLDEGLWLSTQLAFELPPVVEDALLKGIPIYFVAQADLLRERWYWTNKKVASVKRSNRLSYHPLTRRWRINVVSGETGDTSQGLALNQNFESLDEALTTIRRIFRWKIANLADLEPSSTYEVDFLFQLDVNQLPRPLQIGTLGQSDWIVSRRMIQALGPESSK
ncbi:MAG: DUF4390 domain-containing protein [Comamonadaceae bacterium]|nr:DUF4390 domain-containing protein [Comamonadaceae bacterium]